VISPHEPEMVFLWQPVPKMLCRHNRNMMLIILNVRIKVRKDGFIFNILKNGKFKLYV